MWAGYDRGSDRRRERLDAGTDVWQPGVCAQEAEDPAGTVPGAARVAGALGRAGGPRRTGLSQAGARTAALPPGRDAARSLRAALLQPQRPGDRGPALRGRVGTPLLRTQPQWADPRRVDDPALPPPLGAASAGRGAAGDDQRAAGRPGACGCRPARSWTPASSRRRPRPRTSVAGATRRCIRPRRATSGTSG